MRLEHVGVAVTDAERAVALLDRLLEARPYKTEPVPSERVNTIFFDAGDAKLELVEATHPDSPIARHIERRGDGLHHLAFAVDDLEATLARLKAQGFRLLNDAPKRGADGKLIAFVHPKDAGGVLVEFCQAAPLPLQPAFAASGGGRVAFYQSGPAHGQPLLLLHAALGSVELELRPLIERLERRFRILAIDFSGHGSSSDLADPEITVERFVQDVIAVLDHLGIERTRAFGYSMGGAVALHAACRHPERFDRLAVHGASARWEIEEVEAMLPAIDPHLLDAADPGRAAALARAHGEERWRRLGAAMARFIRRLPATPFLDDELATITQPVLVSHGDSDRYVRIERALHLWRTLPNASLVVHPQAGHMLARLDAGRFAATLAHFFDPP